jgi:hypothetical protein
MPWDSAATLKRLEAMTAKVASSWHFIAENTKDPTAHETARARAAILGVVMSGDPKCLRDLAGRAATDLARMNHATSVGFSGVRAAAFDQFHELVTGYLRPSWAAPEAARDAIATEEIARSMVTLGRGLAEIRQLVAFYCPELFPLPDTLDGRVRLTPAWVRRLVAALDRVRNIGDPPEAAERVIVQFLLTVGVPETKARAVWDYRKKRVKRSKWTEDTRGRPGAR